MAEWEKQINAMTLVVGDLERSKTFYREAFGLLPLDEEEDLAVFGFKDLYIARCAGPGRMGDRAARSEGDRRLGRGRTARPMAAHQHRHDPYRARRG